MFDLYASLLTSRKFFRTM